MQPDAYLDALGDNAVRLANAAEGNLSAAVPSCPGWAVADLVAHTGAVHRIWAYHIGERRHEPTGDFPIEILAGVPGIENWVEAMRRGEQVPAPQSPELLLWFREGARHLEAVLRATDPQEPIWHWSEDNRALSHRRMMAIETAVHRWDAECARGEATPIATNLAVDGITHTFTVMAPLRRRMHGAPPGVGERYRFRAGDTGDVWTLHIGPGGTSLQPPASDADVALEGTASDLFLYLWQRVPAERLRVEGDTALLDRYFELVPPV